MGRKPKLPAPSIFRRFYASIATILGFPSQSRYTKRLRQKRLQTRDTNVNQHLTVQNNNHNHVTENFDQQKLLCILVDNQKTIDRIQHLLSINRSRVIDMRELVELAQTPTMFTCSRPTSCASLSTQSENVRRLKALEFIRLFLETNKEEFFQQLLDEQHLCQQKSRTIYRMIKQLLKDIYRREEQHRENLCN